jgi:hypothetical protein
MHLAYVGGAHFQNIPRQPATMLNDVDTAGRHHGDPGRQFAEWRDAAANTPPATQQVYG